MINTVKWVDKFGDRFNIKYTILLVLATLHYEGKITDEKLKGQFQSLRKGELQKKKKTYHCGINDQWYNDESVLTIFQEIVSDKGLKQIPFVNFIKYIQSFENVNYNYALNVFGTEYIYLIFNYWNPEWHSLAFDDFSGFYIPGVKITDYSHSCYECGHTHKDISKNETENLKIINEWLHNKKKGDLKKIPFCKIENHVGWPF